MKFSYVYVIIIVFIVVFIANRAFSTIVARKRAVIRKYIELESACRGRTENVVSLLKSVKNELKETEPQYETTLTALKATLETSKVLEQSKLETELCNCLEKLTEVIRKYDSLREKEEVRKFHKLLAASDAEIAYKAREYNEVVELYNQSLGKGLGAFVAKNLFRFDREDKFNYKK